MKIYSAKCSSFSKFPNFFHILCFEMQVLFIYMLVWCFRRFFTVLRRLDPYWCAGDKCPFSATWGTKWLCQQRPSIGYHGCWRHWVFIVQLPWRIVAASHWCANWEHTFGRILANVTVPWTHKIPHRTWKCSTRIAARDEHDFTTAKGNAARWMDQLELQGDAPASIQEFQLAFCK